MEDYLDGGEEDFEIYQGAAFIYVLQIQCQPLIKTQAVPMRLDLPVAG